MPNRLIDEQSPYLLQHAHNPVDWYPWGDEAFAKAEKEHKPVLVSIGYAACHWCHVMERESFEDQAVAAFMNEHFINIKVDREEHPGVDHLYMDAVQAISGSGGWPLNVFVTPGRLPFYGGTYYPPRPAFNRPSWPQLLERIHNIWTNQQDEIQAQSGQMVQYLQQANAAFAAKGTEWDMDTCRTMADNLLKMADKELGGFGKAPKFPGSMAISFLLEHYHFTKYEPALQQALLSLDAMINGGIYDQLGGGFARYSTDDEWLAPHFEKMLYDNALLVMSLCDAYALTKEAKYSKVIEQTIAFVERELKDPAGGYYSALDADSEGVEGKFYTWTWEEWVAIFGEDNELLVRYFGVAEEGNWEHTNILHIAEDIPALAKRTGLPADDIEKRVEAAKQALFSVRNKRIRPLTDDKCLLSWNALMNLALSKAAATLANDAYLQYAAAHMQWMLDHFTANGETMHVWKNGRAKIAANLDDYAYLVQALLQLTQATGEEKWIKEAGKYTDTVLHNFTHESGNFFYFSSAAQSDIPVRKIDLYDSALPSANAVMAQNMLVLGMCMEKTEWMEHAYYMLQQMASTASRYTYSFSWWAMLLQRYAKGMKAVVVTGSEAHILQKQLLAHFLPHTYIFTSKKEISDVAIANLKFFTNENLIFVCTHQACLPPTADLASALASISL